MMFIIALIATVSFSSCSSDDDGGSFEAPAYEKSAKLFEVNSANSSFKSIEFSESGNYIITKNSSAVGYARNMEKVSFVMAQPWAVATRAGYSQIIYGKYTMNGDNTYVLEGFGTITVAKDSGTAVSLTIQETGKESYVLTASESQPIAASGATNKLCRTWSFDKIRLRIPVVGFDGTYAATSDGVKQMASDLSKKVGETVDPDELINLNNMPTEIIFTKAGTYMVKYKNGSLAIAKWFWKDEAEGVLRYSWNYESFNTGVSGNANISYSGNHLIVEENANADDAEVASFQWLLTEKK